MKTFASILRALGTISLAAACSSEPSADENGNTSLLNAGVIDAGSGSDGASKAGNRPTRDAGAGEAGKQPTRDAGDAGSGPALQPAQLQDVSIMFPLAQPADLETSYVKVTDVGLRGTLFPSALYEVIRSAHPLAARYDTWKVVALRIDPCFGATSADPHGVGCENQLRLVVQPLTVTATATPAVAIPDMAIHLFYRVTRQDIGDLARALIALRVANSSGQRLGPLGPHPIMRTQGLGGAMASGVRALVLKYAGASNLIKVASLNGIGELTWTFLMHDVVDANAGTAVRVSPFAVPAGTTGQGVNSIRNRFPSQNPGLRMRLSPASTSPDSIAALMNDEEIAVFDATQRGDALSALLRIENPNDHSPTTVDCGSCHMASPVMSRQAPLLGLSRSGNPAAFVPDGAWVLPSEMQAIEPSTGFLNVHAFSYTLRQQVAVNQRTVNESAAVVQYLNANLLK